MLCDHSCEAIDLKDEKLKEYSEPLRKELGKGRFELPNYGAVKLHELNYKFEMYFIFTNIDCVLCHYEYYKMS